MSEVDLKLWATAPVYRMNSVRTRIVRGLPAVVVVPSAAGEFFGPLLALMGMTGAVAAFAFASTLHVAMALMLSSVAVWLGTRLGVLSRVSLSVREVVKVSGLRRRTRWVEPLTNYRSVAVVVTSDSEGNTQVELMLTHHALATRDVLVGTVGLIERFRSTEQQIAILVEAGETLASQLNVRWQSHPIVR